jgi:hypothetical protein
MRRTIEGAWDRAAINLFPVEGFVSRNRFGQGAGGTIDGRDGLGLIGTADLESDGEYQRNAHDDGTRHEEGAAARSLAVAEYPSSAVH